MEKPAASYSLLALLDVMARLRDPEGGCPWDLVQNFKTIAPYTIEEAYEVAEAIRLNDMTSLKEELGDLLLQVVFHARMAEEAGHFTFADVAQGIADKMIGRHPHVFGSENAENSNDVKLLWDDIKDRERAVKSDDFGSILDDVPVAMPAIMRAQKLQKRAARVGFEWENYHGVLDKIEEEIAELRQAEAQNDAKAVHEEIGDLLFCMVNLGRMMGVDCESALRDCNDKFINRFNGIEKELKAKNKDFSDLTLAELETIWQMQKHKERA
jgi:MazG family protein